jgi:hypothetical protein
MMMDDGGGQWLWTHNLDQLGNRILLDDGGA